MIIEVNTSLTVVVILTQILQASKMSKLETKMALLQKTINDNIEKIKETI